MNNNWHWKPILSSRLFYDLFHNCAFHKGILALHGQDDRRICANCLETIPEAIYNHHLELNKEQVA